MACSLHSRGTFPSLALSVPFTCMIIPFTCLLAVISLGMVSFVHLHDQLPSLVWLSFHWDGQFPSLAWPVISLALSVPFTRMISPLHLPGCHFTWMVKSLHFHDQLPSLAWLSFHLDGQIPSLALPVISLACQFPSPEWSTRICIVCSPRSHGLRFVLSFS
jgi:hypothetical protein